MERSTSPRYSRSVNLRSTSSNSPNLPRQVDTKPEINKDIPPGFTYAQSTQTNPLPIILLILFVSPYIKKEKASSVLMDNDMNNYIDDYFDDMDPILDILSSIHPYMYPEFQDGINFIFGLFETRAKLKSLINGTYQTSRILSTAEQPKNYQERAIGIIKALQPYISLENQTIINRILDVNSTMEKLAYRVTKFRQQDIEAQGSMGSNIARVTEIIDIIKILIPVEQQQHINQISKILKVIETVELTQLLNPPSQDDSPSKVETKDRTKENGSPPPIDKESVSEKGGAVDDKVGNVTNALKTMLNPEQAKSLDLIMKMAQLMSQNSADKNSAD